MPRKAEWIHRLDGAIAQLRELSAPAVDRAAVERLLAVSPRQALRIMHRLAPQSAGHSLLILRQDLIARLEELRQGGAVQSERRRVERLTGELERGRSQQAARHVKIPAPAFAAAGFVLPEAIRLEPGRLEIRFESGEQLLGLLLELAQAVAGDLDQFQAAVGERPSDPASPPVVA